MESAKTQKSEREKRNNKINPIWLDELMFNMNSTSCPVMGVLYQQQLILILEDKQTQ